MADREIDLDASVYTLSKSHPEIIELLASMGFKDILKPGMIESAGRFMTIPKGAALKKIALLDIIKQLETDGFIIKDREELK